MSKETGGSAFPFVKQTHNDETDEVISATRLEAGMTLRDYFAAKAMQSLLSDIKMSANLAEALEMSLESYVVKASYEMADAMIEARKK